MARFALAVVVAWSAFGTAFADWTPPENPDPSKILNEAQADARAKRYEDALAKHIWFHRNALKYQRSQYGVRLSFALMYWKDLGKAYPPALKAMKDVRDEAEQSIKAGGDLFAVFHDYRALNEALGEPEKTTAAFIAIEDRNPEAAKTIYSLAEPALIEAKEFKRCGRYLKPKDTLTQARRTWEQLKPKPETPPGRAVLDRSTAESLLTGQVVPLIALLVLNERRAEAEETAAQAREICDSQQYREAIDRALEGKFAAD